MPEITELLHDAAPTARPFDEGAVRALVARRRRRRRGAMAAALVTVIGAGGALVLPAADDDQPVQVAAEPPAGSKLQGVTAVEVADGQAWVAYEGGDIGPEGEPVTAGIGVNVRSLHDDGDRLWALGDDGATVAAVGPDEGVHVWIGERIEDLEPLGDGQAAVSSSASDEVIVLELTEDGLHELSRISLGEHPTNLVLTRGNGLWVNDGDVICRLDVASGEAVDEQPWTGALLAPSASGGIWAVEGDRVVDLAPTNLAVGVSAAEGARYDFAGATMAVTAGDRLYVGGPAGIVQFAANDQLGMPVTTDEPVSMAIDGAELVYVAGGSVHRFNAEQAEQAETEAALTDAIRERQAAAAPDSAARWFLAEELRWPDAVIDDIRTPVGSAGPAETLRLVDATSPTLGHVRVSVNLIDDVWVVGAVTTFDGDDFPATVSLGNGTDHVSMDFRADGLTPELTVRYGDHETVLTATDGVARWEGDLGWEPDLLGTVQVLFLDAAGVSVEAWRTSFAPGPFEMPAGER